MRCPSRWLLIVTTVLAAAILAVACGEEEEAATTPEATTAAEPTEAATEDVPAVSETPSPQTSTEMPDEDGFRQFIPMLQAALDSGDLAFLTERAQTVPVVCTAEDVQGGLGGAYCEFEGQSYDGFTVGYWRSEGAILPVSLAFSPFETLFSTVQPAAADEFGDGKTRVYALNVGDDRYDAIVTAMIERPEDFADSGPLRVAIGTSWAFAENRWVLTGTLVAFVLAEELLRPSEETPGLYPNWEPYQAP